MQELIHNITLPDSVLLLFRKGLTKLPYEESAAAIAELDKHREEAIKKVEEEKAEKSPAE